MESGGVLVGVQGPLSATRLNLSMEGRYYASLLCERMLHITANYRLGGDTAHLWGPVLSRSPTSLGTEFSWVWVGWGFFASNRSAAQGSGANIRMRESSLLRGGVRPTALKVYMCRLMPYLLLVCPNIPPLTWFNLLNLM